MNKQKNENRETGEGAMQKSEDTVLYGTESGDRRKRSGRPLGCRDKKPRRRCRTSANDRMQRHEEEMKNMRARSVSEIVRLKEGELRPEDDVKCLGKDCYLYGRCIPGKHVRQGDKCGAMF